MLKKKIVVLLTLLGVTSVASAAGANSDAYFDGFYGQVEVGVGSQTNAVGISAGGATETYSFGNTQPQYALTAGYSKKIFDLPGDNDINLAANISYNFTNGNSGSVKYAAGSESGYYSFNTKNIMSFSLEPGYYLSKHGLGYLKLGYAQGQTSFTSNSANTTPQFGTQSGYLFGFGFKHGLNAAHPNVFWGIEAYQINMNSKSVQDANGLTWTSKPTLVFGKVHLGYMF